MGSLKPTDFAPYADPASAFTGTLVGAMGLVDEYDDIKSFKDACDKLGLNPGWYDGGFAFLVTIPSDNIDKATGAGGGPKLNMGKPSLDSSLAFSEFDYVVEDRATNATAMNDKTNSGVVDPRGKTEVTVNNISYSELFAQPVRVLK